MLTIERGGGKGRVCNLNSKTSVEKQRVSFIYILLLTKGFFYSQWNFSIDVHLNIIEIDFQNYLSYYFVI